LKEKYEKIQSELPVFMQSWWLYSLCGEDWQPCMTFDKKGEVTGAMIYHFAKKYGMSMILPLPLSPVSGIWFNYPILAQKSHSKYNFEIQITEKLIAQLPKTYLTITQLGVSFTNWLPFHWQNYKQRTRYTYVIENITNLGAVHNNFNDSIKQNLKKSLQDLKVEESENVDLLYKMSKEAIERSKGKLNYTQETLNMLYFNIKKNNAGQIFEVQNTDNQAIGIALIVWDKETAYLLISGDTKKHKSTITVLIWRVLEILAQKGINNFDFEGSMLPHVEPFNRSFGATQKPYHLIFKAKNRFFEMLFALKGII
jgi:hypothetical protein